MRLAFALMLLSAVSAWAAEPAEPVTLDGKPLLLNGEGLRTRFFFKVYTIGLYLPEKKRDAAQVLALPGPKRIALRMLRDVGADTFSEALVEGLKANHTQTDYEGLEPRVKQLEAIMARVKEAKKGMAIALDWTRGATRISIDGRPAGEPIAGEDFYRALLRIWLGEHPVQDDVKQGLLGG